MTQQFLTIYKKYTIIEGGYSNDPDDRGGETWRGIARNFWPQWEGWKIVDHFKTIYSAKQNFVDALKNDLQLDQFVKEFYKQNFYDVFEGDACPAIIADELYDIAINCGVPTCIKYLQRACNLLNRNSHPDFYRDVEVDGKFGANTKHVLVMCLIKNGEKLLYNVLNCFQGMHYIGAMEGRATNEKYIGWFSRVTITK
jgi:lysozyme family protein